MKLALLSGATTVGLGTLNTAFAQDAASDERLEEITVTGSRILKTNLVTASRVVQLDAEQLEFSGATRVEDVLGSMPQVYLDQSSGQSIESTGTATMQLRNLGNSRRVAVIVVTVAGDLVVEHHAFEIILHDEVDDAGDGVRAVR